MKEYEVLSVDGKKYIKIDFIESIKDLENEIINLNKRITVLENSKVSE